MKEFVYYCHSKDELIVVHFKAIRVLWTEAFSNFEEYCEYIGEL